MNTNTDTDQLKDEEETSIFTKVLESIFSKILPDSKRPYGLKTILWMVLFILLATPFALLSLIPNPFRKKAL